MHLRLLSCLAIATLGWTSFATAHTAITTEAVSVRAAPDRRFPMVTSLLGRTSVTVIGCVDNWRWCDIVAGRDRGWVYARYLSYVSGDRAVTILRGGPDLGLPAATFTLGPYWEEHYRRRPWFGKQAYWQRRWDRRPAPPEWSPPRSPVVVQPATTP